jgi:hypothetical protein
MEDKVEAIRAKRDSSMRVGLRLVREGQANGFVTAGNTGAAMATAKVVLGAVPGVDRPALAAVFPTALRAGGDAARCRALTSTARRKISNSLPSWATFTFGRSMFGDVFGKRPG